MDLNARVVTDVKGSSNRWTENMIYIANVTKIETKSNILLLVSKTKLWIKVSYLFNYFSKFHSVCTKCAILVLAIELIIITVIIVIILVNKA